MQRLDRLIRMSFGLGALAFVGLIFSVLALMDISSGAEANLALEWNMVRASLLVILMFMCVSMITIWKLRRSNRDEGLIY